MREVMFDVKATWPNGDSEILEIRAANPRQAQERAEEALRLGYEDGGSVHAMEPMWAAPVQPRDDLDRIRDGLQSAWEYRTENANR